MWIIPSSKKQRITSQRNSREASRTEAIVSRFTPSSPDPSGPNSSSPPVFSPAPQLLSPKWTAFLPRSPQNLSHLHKYSKYRPGRNPQPKKSLVPGSSISLSLRFRPSRFSTSSNHPVFVVSSECDLRIGKPVYTLKQIGFCGMPRFCCLLDSATLSSSVL